MTIKFDPSAAEAALRRITRTLSPKQLQKAEARGLNRAIRGARTEVSREVRKQWNIKASRVKESVTLKRASAGDKIPTASLIIKQNKIPLKDFRPRQNRKGVAVTIRKGKRQTYRGAFIVTHTTESVEFQAFGHVFTREGSARLPIRLLYGPSVRALAPEAVERAGPAVAKRVAKELVRSIDLEIKRAFPDG